MVPKAKKGGISVGSYIYALRDLTDVAGTVSVSKAMDLMMKCHKDKHQDSEQEEVDELLGETYNPKNAENYKATGGKCSVKSVQNELNALPAGDKSDARCQVTCETSSVDKDNYTAECS